MDKKLRKRLRNRVVSIVAAMVLCMTIIPIHAKAEETAKDVTNRIADEATLDTWKEYFSSQTVTTEYAGAVWTDKTVLTSPEALGNPDITMKEENGFLVTLSAMGSTMNIMGMNNAPTDTILILDISGSMNDNKENNDVVEELVEATNASIADLLRLNPNNRIGVVLYSNQTTTILPLGRYTTADDNQYLNYIVASWGQYNPITTEYVGIDPEVTVEGTDRKPKVETVEVSGSTYIQKGIKTAVEEFLAKNNSTTVDGVKRTPILVLMSDGAPTLATTSFTNPEVANMGDGTTGSIRPEMGFATQLTMAYAKTQIEQKYATKSYFYTVGLGISNNSVASSVLNPTASNGEIQEFWNNYQKAKVNETITISGKGIHAKKVTKISTNLDQNYINKYFDASGNSGNLAQELKNAFAQVIGVISLQSRYYPTLVAENDETSGYVSFVDYLGDYMEVTDIKGILLGETLFTPVDSSDTEIPEENITVKSYIFSGKVNEALGVRDTDMMHIIVQVMTDITTGTETILFAVPAALLPTVSYNVNMNENRVLTSLTLTGATAPIRLIYEVALKEETVSNDHINSHTNSEGGINFYTNRYRDENSHSYFNPSKQNDHYYYQEDVALYSDTAGTLYTGTTQPTTAMYRAHTIYQNVDGLLSWVTEYDAVADEMLSAAVWDTAKGVWYIPKGNTHINHEDCVKMKTENKTETLAYVTEPVVDISKHSIEGDGYHYIVTSILGNNGKLTVTLEEPDETETPSESETTEEPETPSESETTEEPEIPNTGDNLLSVIYGAVLLLAGLGLVFATFKLRKRENNKN